MTKKTQSDTSVPVLRAQMIDPRKVVLDENVRKAAKPPKALIESIRTQGVLVPVIAHEDMLGNIVVTDGQLRVLSAREVGWEKIPVFIGPAPGSAEARVIEQMTANTARVAMDKADLAAAVQQLTLFGVEASTIARKTGLGSGEVEGLQRIAKSSATQEAIAHKPEMTIIQAATLSELLEHRLCTPEMRAEAMEKLKKELPVNVIISGLKHQLEEEEGYRAVEDSLAAEGVSSIRVEGWYNSPAQALYNLKERDETLLTEANHESCPGHVMLVFWKHASEDRYVVAEWGCADFRAHGHLFRHENPESDAEHAAAEQERKAARERRLQYRREWQSANSERREFACQMIRKKRAGMAEDLIRLAYVPDPHDEDYVEWLGEDPTDLLEAAKVVPTRVTAPTWAASSAAAAQKALLASLLEGILGVLDDPPTDESANHIAKILNQFVSWGYEPSAAEAEFMELFEADQWEAI